MDRPRPSAGVTSRCLFGNTRPSPGSPFVWKICTQEPTFPCLTVIRSNTTIRLRARPLPPKTFVTVPSLDSHSNSLPIHRERHAIVNEAILTTLLRRG